MKRISFILFICALPFFIKAQDATHSVAVKYCSSVTKSMLRFTLGMQDLASKLDSFTGPAPAADSLKGDPLKADSLSDSFEKLNKIMTQEIQYLRTLNEIDSVIHLKVLVADAIGFAQTIFQKHIPRLIMMWRFGASISNREEIIKWLASFHNDVNQVNDEIGTLNLPAKIFLKKYNITESELR